jgi:hypothetical protein
MRNRFHSICPYFAMFPETFVEKWVDRIVPRRGVIIDPFCGRGTTPFQAGLMGRRSIACDVNPVAYCVTKAKTDPPAYESIIRRLRELELRFVRARTKSDRGSSEFFIHAFSEDTFRQIVFLRANLDWKRSRVDCMIAALVLGSLHGEARANSPYLSNQMPRTISTKPDYSVRFWKERSLSPPKRDAFGLLRRMAKFRYVSAVPKQRASTYFSDMRELPRLLNNSQLSVRYAITSPPYLDVTNFHEDQWLRVWFLGGPEQPEFRRGDDRHTNRDKFWAMISDFWRVLGLILGQNSQIVVRLGGRGLKDEQLVDGLLGTATFSGRRVQLKSWERSELLRRQTGAFRPGSTGVTFEVDCHFDMR